MAPRLGSLAIFLALALVPACSSTPQCVIDTDCPFGQYCTNTPGGSGGSCVVRGGGVDMGPTGDAFVPRDTGPTGDTGATPDMGPRDAGPDTGASTDANYDAPRG